MYGTLACLTMMALGIEVGWQPLPDGGMEYIIQIEPHMLETLQSGEDFTSDIPPDLRGVRNYRITVGTGRVPRVQPEPPATEPPRPLQGSVNPSPTGPFVGPFALAGNPAAASEPPKMPGPIRSAESPSDLVSPRAPRTLPPAAGSKPLGEQAATFLEQEVSGAGDGATQPDVEEGSDPPKPWMPLTLSVAAMFGAIGGMLYFAWIAWDYRRRYRGLLERLIEAGGHQVTIAEAMDASNR